jgi:hypothetical protein
MKTNIILLRYYYDTMFVFVQFIRRDGVIFWQRKQKADGSKIILFVHICAM